jgi:hypothetical protein
VQVSAQLGAGFVNVMGAVRTALTDIWNAFASLFEPIIQVFMDSGAASLTWQTVVSSVFKVIATDVLVLKDGIVQLVAIFEALGKSIAAAAVAVGTWGDIQEKLGKWDFAGAAAIAKQNQQNFVSGWEEAFAKIKASAAKTELDMAAIWDKAPPGPPKAAGDEKKGGATYTAPDKNAAALLKAQEALAKANAQAMLAIVRDTDAEELKSDTELYQQKKLDFETYFQTKRDLADLDAQMAIRAAEQELVAAKTAALNAPNEAARVEAHAKVVALQGQINDLKLKEENTLKDINREETAATEALNKQLALTKVKSSNTTGTNDITAERNAANFRVALNQETNAQLLQQERIFEEQRYQQARLETETELSQLGPMDIAGKAALNAKLLDMDQQHAEAEREIDRKLALDQQQFGLQAFKGLKDDMSSFISDALSGTDTISAAFKKLGASIRTTFANLIAQKFMDKLMGPGSGISSMVDAAIGMVEKMVSQIVTTFTGGQATQTSAVTAGNTERSASTETATATTIASAKLADAALIEGYAAVAAVAAMGSVAAIPYYGWAMAEETGAETYAAGLAYIASAAGGWWQVPNDTITNIHKDEMVIPAAESKGLRSMISNGGGSSGGITHLHGKPNDSITLRNLAASLKQANRRFQFVG